MKLEFLAAADFNGEVIFGAQVRERFAWIYLPQRSNIKIVRVFEGDSYNGKKIFYRHRFKGYFLPIDATLDEIRRFFDFIAPQYDQLCQENEQLGIFLLGLMQEMGQKTGDTILDIMAGTGLPNRILYKAGYVHQTLLDVSLKMLQIAKRQMPLITIRRGSVEHFSPPQEYDVVISILGCHYLKAKYIGKKLKRLIQRKGNIYIIDLEELAPTESLKSKKKGIFTWFNGERDVELYYYIL